MLKRCTIIVAGICVAFCVSAFPQTNSPASAATDAKTKPQKESQAVAPPTPEAPAPGQGQKAAQKTTAGKAQLTPQAEPSGATQAIKTVSKKAQPAGTPGTDANYTAALADLGDRIVSNGPPGCLAQYVNLSAPDCVVEDVTRLPDGTTSVRMIPHCDKAHSSLPCWRIEVKPQCSTISKQSIAITLDRGSLPVPPNTTAQVSCADNAAGH